MKTIVLSFLCLLTVAATSQQLFDNGDDVRRHTYGFDIPFSLQLGNGIGGAEWPGWHGTLVQYFPNPGPNGVNDSPNCLEYSRNPSETYDVLIIETGLFDDLGDYVSGAKKMSMDIFSPVPGVVVQITLENVETSSEAYPTGRHSEYTATTTTGAQWETIEFDFTVTPDETLSDTEIERMVILFNPGNNVAQTFYIDNLYGPEMAEEPCEELNGDDDIINDFDCNQGKWEITYADGRLSLFPNPAANDVNETATCLEYARNGGAMDDVIVGSFGETIDLSNGAEISMKTMDTAAPSILVFSLQDSFGNVIDEQTLSTTVSDEWEELIFDFSAAATAPNITNWVILYEPGQAVAESIYIDEIEILTEDIPDNIDDVIASTLNIFPNPGNGMVQINGLEAGAQVSLVNLTGQKIDQFVAQSTSVNRDFSDHASGYYILQVLQNGQLNSSRLIIE